MADSRQRSTGANKKNTPQTTIATEASRGGRLRLAFLLGTAFCCGAAIMIIELAGNRILAPWFGNSTCTWTALIGVVLISLSGGYYLGGFLADRWPSYTVLAHLLIGSALLTMIVPALQLGMGDSLSAANPISGPILATLLLLAAPACLLATVSPFTVKLLSQLSDDHRVGFSAGFIGMSATLGSVLGTFSAGFVLIPLLSLNIIFWGVGAVLGALAMADYVLFSDRLRRSPVVLPLVLAALVLASTASLQRKQLASSIIFEQTTPYHRIRVLESPLDDGDRARYLFLDTTPEGGQTLRSRQPTTPYQQSWELSRVFFSKLQRAAFIGGGGFLMPEAMLDAFPELQADVLEIDPAVIEVGRKYFRTDQYPGLHAIAGDARRFLRLTPERYDLIVGDAFHGVRSIPGHLVTAEFFDLVRRRLTDQGVYLMNIVSSVEGKPSAVFQAVTATLKQVFPNVYVFASETDRLDAMQNVTLVASMRDLQIASLAAQRESGERVQRLLQGYLDERRYDIARAPILRDACNPIEYLVALGLADSPSRGPAGDRKH